MHAPTYPDEVARVARDLNVTPEAVEAAVQAQLDDPATPDHIRTALAEFRETN